MPEIDFEKEFSDFALPTDGGSGAIREIYDIIPAISTDQQRIHDVLHMFSLKWDLGDLNTYCKSYVMHKTKNKNLDFLSSMNMKTLMKAYTMEEFMRGVAVSRTTRDED